MATPGSFNFVAEFLCFLGSFYISIYAGFLISLGIVLSAAYSIYLYTRVTGGTSSLYLPHHSDINKREFVICFGLYPSFILNDIQFDFSGLILDVSSPNLHPA
jgi:NADH-ubiquinone oxidoreductase chain 4